MVPFAKHTASDGDIVRRCWLFIDFDPVRPAGISATDAEHEAALERARRCRDWLHARGWPAPLAADSGNGSHLAYRLGLENTNENTQMLKSVLLVLGLQFSDSTVQVDPNTYNASRIVKVWGTVAAKGDNLPARPHRLSRLVDVPLTLEPASVELLAELAARVPKAESQAQAGPVRSRGSSFDLDHWIVDHSLKVDGPTSWSGGRRWVFEVCPFNPEHRDRSAYIVQLPNGAIAAGCLHRSCQGKNWSALRDLIDPSWCSRGTSAADVAKWDSPKQGLKITLVDSADFLSRRSVDEGPDLIEGLIPPKRYVVYQGRPKTGKSHSLLQLAFDVACGLDVFGRFKVRAPIKVGYFELEEPEGQTKARFRSMLQARSKQGPEAGYLRFFTREDLFRLKLVSYELLTRGQHALAEVISESRIELVILIALRKLAQAG